MSLAGFRTAASGLLAFALLACCADRKSAAPTTPTAPTPASTPTPPADFRPLVDGQGLVTFTTPKGELSFRVEVVNRPESRAQGLMWRRAMDADAGMLFIFPDEEIQSFWMHNTLLPLDMVFINANRQIVGIVENAAPLTDTPRGVGLPSQYVLELNAGVARKSGLAFGMTARWDWRPF